MRDADPGRGAALRELTRRFRSPTGRESATQVVTAFAALAACFAAIYAALGSGWPWPSVVPLQALAALLTVRVFVLQHDAGHGSLFRDPRANLATGLACSLATLTPFAHWRRQHAGHHARWNDLDARDRGADIYSTCVTAAEFEAASPARRRFYRTIWNPIVALLLLPPLVFLALYRFAFDTPPDWKGERRSVHLTNLALLVLFGGLVWAFGWRTVLVAHLPVMAMAAIVGVWLFSLQHRFEGASWRRGADWTADEAALSGSSWLDLPQPLRWFTGDIGYHHIHHLDPRVPNYRLSACHEAGGEAFAGVKRLTLREGLSAMRFCLWDEARARLVPLPAERGRA